MFKIKEYLKNPTIMWGTLSGFLFIILIFLTKLQIPNYDTPHFGIFNVLYIIFGLFLIVGTTFA